MLLCNWNWNNWNVKIVLFFKPPRLEPPFQVSNKRINRTNKVVDSCACWGMHIKWPARVSIWSFQTSCFTLCLLECPFVCGWIARSFRSCPLERFWGTFCRTGLMVTSQSFCRRHFQTWMPNFPNPRIPHGSLRRGRFFWQELTTKNLKTCSISTIGFHACLARIWRVKISLSERVLQSVTVKWLCKAGFWNTWFT